MRVKKVHVFAEFFPDAAECARRATQVVGSVDKSAGEACFMSTCCSDRFCNCTNKFR